ncbi:hypothetical protein AUC71_12415 [Methyloceanibacter marginalis]|jgi:predicted membrane protein DUF2232|uniref:DUF2232 domain-containing protein n=1 Tax=Methyloceanibacter marginalis TaxID=1774971 RepID=A0A1E3WAW8_9HYPH|nr:DUF2232 domain-containing protein [Methyloceanibacter marginalis]ODS02949.1 hypothetical protein AUC71_12415 [Methyloceanibacter marginalis]
MSAHLLIGAGAGLVSAALFASAAVSAALASFLLYLCPLPLCLAGLGWGRSSILIGGLAATVVMALTLGPAASLVYALTIAAPAAFLVHLLLQARPAAGPEGEKSGALEWYPAGRLVGAAALMAGALAGVMVLLLGPDAESYRASIAEMLPHILKALDPDDSVFKPEMVENLETVLAKALPAAFAVLWLTVMLFNLWLAGYIVAASGRSLRPWPDLHGLEVPNIFVAVFAGALVASFIPGIIGLIATGFAGAMLFAYVLQGLAVIHVYSLGVPFRPLLLAVVYLGILLLGWLAIIVAILGLAEPLLGLRARSARPGSSSNNNDND